MFLLSRAQDLRSRTVAEQMGQDETQRTEASAELEEDLRRIVAGQAVPVFHFQPIADLRRASVAGYEALVRLPVRAGLPPDVCLREANRLGIGVELETLLARRALAARRLLPENSFLSLNVSPALLVSEAWAQLQEEAVDLSRAVVEITEEQSIRDYADIRSRVAGIQARGGAVAIDDAGAGYASLKHILELRPAFIKLDRNFVAHCDTDRAKSAIIEMMGAAASRIDAWIIAEGVETRAELVELLHLGVPLAQGYYLGRPAPEMLPLSTLAHAELQTNVLQRAPEDDLLLWAEICPRAASRAEAEGMLQEQPECSMVAVVDAWERPSTLVEQHPVSGIRALTQFMQCQGASNLQETLQRALTRPAPVRFDPVVLIDTEGRLQGIARLDRLMQAVLRGAVPETGNRAAPAN